MRKLKSVYIKRLEKLRDHLAQPQEKLAHDKFCFDVWNGQPSRASKKKFATRGCGTAGCAFGELPYLFPDEFMWGDGCVIRTKPTSSPHNIVDGSSNFFGLTSAESLHLFMPNNQNPDAYGGIYLRSYSSLPEVTENMRIFIDKLKAGEINGQTIE